MNRSRVFTIFIYVVILVLTIWSLFPLLWGLATSFKSDKDIFTSPPQWIPLKPTLEHYYNLIVLGGFARNIFNSVYIATLATIISLIGGSLAAYPLARYRFAGDSIILLLILSAMMIPGICNLIPIYVMLSKLGLLNTYTGVIFIFGGWGIPYAVWIMRGFFQALPQSLEDAGRVDGCNRLQILFRIIVPISAPGLITTTIFLFINSWNNYIAARTYLHAAEKFTIPVKIFEMMTQELQDWGGTNAASFISYLPILLLYALLSKYFIAGLLRGSSK
jgi:ABC-type glycerol-3-phosphate transport system permease component